MIKYPYSEKEVTEASFQPGRRGKMVKVFKSPCTAKENYHSTFKDKDQVWMLDGSGSMMFAPNVIPDNIARAFSVEANRLAPSGGKDMFGLDWVYEPTVGGSIEDPTKPVLFDDANDWEEKIVWPDIDSWDWKGSGEANKEYLNTDKYVSLWFLNGCWFERLISFMGFENASIALIDEDQQDAVKALFEKTTDLYIRLVDKCCETYGDGFDAFTVHDDWGSQKDCFFSPQVGKEMIVPYMKKLVDHIHSKGKVADLHSCGCLNKQIANFVEAGWDSWIPMSMNDTHKMYEDFGDKMVISVVADPFDPATTSEAEQYLRGMDFAKRFPNAQLGNNNGEMLTEAFLTGAYVQSRLNYEERHK